jgi:5-methylthioadenosine/S-adenosylhomocysteine deaminase
MEPIDLAITGTTIIANAAAQPIEDGAILVRDGRIVEIGPRPAAPIAARRTIDARGMVAIPGLVNVHTHAALAMVRGVAEDMGFAPAYTKGVPKGQDLTPDEACAIARLGALEAMLFGSTLINDTYVHADVTLPAMAALGLRVFACHRIHDADLARIGDGVWTHDERIGAETLGAAVALAERFHGNSDRIGVQLAAHAPDTCSAAMLRAVARERDRLGLRVATHLSQSKVENARVRERDGVTPTELLDSVGLLDERLIAAHCIHMSDADIARAGRARIRVAHIPKGNATGGTAAPTAKLREAGARLTLGTDNMHADMVEVMRWALAIGRLQAGGVSDDWQPETVLAMATAAGAEAMGLEARIGRLAPGYDADLVLLDFRRPHLTPALDPLGTLVHAGQGSDVHTVIVAGEIVVESGRATRVDGEEIRRDAERAIRAVWKRVA